MIVHNVDVPVNAPQVLAFSAPAAEVQGLQDALRDVYERADGRALQRLWDARIEGYRALVPRVRWDAPAATMQELLEELLRACDVIEAAEPPPFHAPGEGDVDALRAACGAWRSRLDRPVRLTPSEWFHFVLPMRFRLRPFLAGEGIAPLNFEWRYWADRLAGLEGPGLDGCDPDGYGEVVTDDLCGVLAPYASQRFHPESYDRETRESARGPEVSPEQLKDAFRDIVVLADGSECTPYHAWHHIESLTRLRSQLEFLVGPAVVSQGPGPFLGVPDEAELMVDPGWDLMGLFRVCDPTFGFESPSWWVLEPRGISSVLERLPKKPVRWFEQLADPEGEGWGTRHPPSWLAWDDARDLWWPRCRDRYRKLLEDANHRGHCVVFTLWSPDGQGTITAPLSDELGHRVVVD